MGKLDLDNPSSKSSLGDSVLWQPAKTIHHSNISKFLQGTFMPSFFYYSCFHICSFHFYADFQTSVFKKIPKFCPSRRIQNHFAINIFHVPLPCFHPPHIRFHFYSIIVIFTDSVLSPHYTSVSMLIFWNGTHGNLWVNNFYVEDIQVCQFIMHHSSNQGNLITSFTYTLNLHGECGTPKHAHIPL